MFSKYRSVQADEVTTKDRFTVSDDVYVIGAVGKTDIHTYIFACPEDDPSVVISLKIKNESNFRILK